MYNPEITKSVWINAVAALLCALSWLEQGHLPPVHCGLKSLEINYLQVLHFIAF